MDRLFRRGFSLVELLVVLGLLGLLIGLSLPAIQSARRTAARAECQNHLRQIATASHHRATNTGYFPPHVLVGKLIGARTKNYPWGLILTPYLDQEQLWADADRALEVAPPYESPPHIGLTKVVKAYTCPADGRLTAPLDDGRFKAAYTSFVAIDGDRPTPEGPLVPGIMMVRPRNPGVRPSEVTDGLSQTIMYGESPPPGRQLAGSWYCEDLPLDLLWVRPVWRHGTHMMVRKLFNSSCRGPFQFGPGRLDNLCDSHHLWSLHEGGGNFAFGDGSVRFLTYSAASVLPALATRAGGEGVEILQ